MQLDFGSVLFYIAIYIGLFVTLFFLVTIFENWGRHHTTVRKRKWPTVSILVPCFNEERTVARTLDSLLAVDYPKGKLNIVVIDDGSTDSTYAIAKQYVTQGITVWKKRNGGKHTALNYALKRTKSEFVGALDADSTVAKNSLKRLISRFDSDDVMAVTPSLIIDTPKGFLRRIQSIEFLMGVFLRRVFTDVGSQHVTPGPFTIYRRAFFEKYGYYRKAYMTEDIELALRIQSEDYIIENATDAYVYTHGPGTWRGLYKQRLRWYHGFISNIFEYRRLISPKHGNLGLFVIPIFFVSLSVVAAILAYTLTKAVIDLSSQIYQYWLIGFDFWELLEFNFDTFFINTSPVAILGVLTLGLSLSLVLIGKRYAHERKIVFSYILFALFYSWLYVFWWAVAFYHKLLGRNVVWGHKSIAGD